MAGRPGTASKSRPRRTQPRPEGEDEMQGNGTAQAGPATPATAQGPVYEIRLRGQLGPGWAAWFAGLAVTLDDHGDTLLTGPLPDQAALFGVLKRVRDAGLPLLALNCLAAEDAVQVDE